MTAGEFRDALAQLGLNQRRLAQDLGLAVSTVNRWIRGLHPIPRYVEAYLKLLTRPVLIMLDDDGRAHVGSSEAELVSILRAQAMMSPAETDAAWMRGAAARAKTLLQVDNRSGHIRSNTPENFIHDLCKFGFLRVVHDGGRLLPH